jgi:hypothetical protein
MAAPTAGAGSETAALGGRPLLLTALLPPAAAAEREQQALSEYVAFTRQLGLFKLWRKHAKASHALRSAAEVAPVFPPVWCRCSPAR